MDINTHPYSYIFIMHSHVYDEVKGSRVILHASRYVVGYTVNLENSIVEIFA